MIDFVHDTLPCGIEYGLACLPTRPIVSMQIRLLAGAASEPADKLGLARLVEDTLDKGTQQHTGRALSDAFDVIGAGRSSGTGRETTTFTCTVLPEFFEQAVALHAEMLHTPTFPEEACSVNLELARQELVALQDDAHELTDKLVNRQAWGSPLGRHPLGEQETLDNITRDDLVHHWKTQYHSGRLLVAVAGPLERARVADAIEKYFERFGNRERAGRMVFPVEFKPATVHHDKALEQEQIAICWPGVEATHDDFPIQQVLLGILSGGMSGRLFTEVREKQGLVYWVSAWQEVPRGSGMLFLGASTTPDRADKTYQTLLREVDRLADDIQQDELDRAIMGIVAGQETRGDSTRAWCGELASDLFYFGRPIPTEEKLAKIKSVTIADVKRYLETYPRDRLCVVTLGPKPLAPTGGSSPS